MVSLIASDMATPADAIEAARNYAIALPDAIRRHLETASGAPTANDPRFACNETHIIASAAYEVGIDTAVLSDAIEGDAREAGLFHAALALEVARNDHPFFTPVLLLSGGEMTVTVRGNGKGGRNTKCLLSFASRIASAHTITALAVDTDGIDGTEENAGTFADSEMAARLAAAGLDVTALLADNDAWSAFSALDDLFSPGPTGTNVNDFRAILIDSEV